MFLGQLIPEDLDAESHILLGFFLEVQFIEDLNPDLKVLYKDPHKSLALYCMHLISGKKHVVPKILRRFWNCQKIALRNSDTDCLEHIWSK